MNETKYEVQIDDVPVDIARKTIEMWENNEARISDWRKDAVNALNYYMNYLPPKRFPWKNCSNVNIPITRIKTDAMLVTAVQMLLGGSGMFRYKAKGNTPAAAADMINRVMDSEISQSSNFRKENVGFISNLMKYGVSFMQKRYVEYTQVIPRRIVQEVDDPQYEIIQGVPVEFPGTKLEVGMAMVPRIVSTHMLENINPFNVLESPGAQCINRREDMRHARWVLRNSTLTQTDLVMMLNSKGVNRDAVNLLLRGPQDKIKKNEVEEEYENRLGIDNSNEVGGYRAFTLWAWHIVPGQNREILVEYVIADRDSGEPLLLMFRECPYSHYSIPIIHASTDPTAFRGEGIPRMLMPLQEKINTIHNMRNDAGSLSLLKMWKYRLGSRFEKDQEFYPGAMIGVMDMGDLSPVVQNDQGIVPAVQEEILASNYAERLSISDIATGTQSGLNPEQTATGTVTLLNQAEAKVAHMVRLLQHGAYRELAYLYLEDTLQFYPLAKALEPRDISGDNGKQIDSRQAILQILTQVTPGDLELEVLIGDSAGMRAARSQAAMQALSVMSQFPEAQENYPAVKQLFDEIMEGLGYSNIKLMSPQEREQRIQVQAQVDAAIQARLAALEQTNKSLTNIEQEKARALAAQQ